MARQSRFSPEVRERAVRMVFEHGGEYASRWEAICSIAEKIGCSGETLRKWVQQSEVDAGRRGGLTSDEGRPKAALLRSPRGGGYRKADLIDPKERLTAGTGWKSDGQTHVTSPESEGSSPSRTA